MTGKQPSLYAMIEIMDRGIGKLLAELNKLKLEENTLVIFASDNGPDPLVPTRFNRQLRGTKYQVHEGGIRVPLMACWPGRIQPGTTRSLVHFTDIVPTLIEVCQLKHNPRLPLDGVSLLPLLNGKEKLPPRSRCWQWNRGVPNYTHNAAIRSGPWKLVRPFITRGIRLTDSQAAPELYHLEQDPGEKTNLAEKYPDRVRRMNAALDSWCRAVETDRLRKSPVITSD